MIKLKTLMGDRKYLKDPKIEGYFRAQKIRIGKALELLDEEMTKHPKVDTYDAWTQQKLKIKWDTYIDTWMKDWSESYEHNAVW